MPEITSLATRYKQLEDKRSSVLTRARECAKLTIPSLMPPDGSDEQTSLYKPFQSQGARGVNTLASKLMLTLLPPNSPFFRFTINPSLVEQSGADSGEVEATLADMESVLSNHIETSGERVQIFQFLRLLITSGNALLYFPTKKDKTSLKIYRLDQYVCVRDPLGNLLELLIKESISPIAITNEDVKAKVLAKHKAQNSKNHVELYTRVYFDSDKDVWITSQEVFGVDIPEANGEFSKDEMPYLALRWSALPNEDYGRSYVDEVIGDLRSLEALSQARLEATSASAKVVLFVSPNGTTRAVDVASAENLEVLEGNANDVSVLQINKNADLATIRESINDLKQDLAFHFLMNSSIQRQAERVTAEEIRTMASELEESLGGTYTILSQEFQLPYIRLKINKMREIGAFPEGSESIEPLIITGLEGLGRGQDFNKIATFLNIASSLGAQAFSMINLEHVLKSLAISVGIKADNILLDKESLAQQQEMAQMQDFMRTPVAGQLAGGVAKDMQASLGAME